MRTEKLNTENRIHPVRRVNAVSFFCAGIKTPIGKVQEEHELEGYFSDIMVVYQAPNW